MILKSLLVENVNQALSEGLWWLKVAGVKEDSRNGKVIVAPGPVVTITSNPLARVISYPGRNANPFFHLFEAIWMFAGSDDAQWLAQYNPRMLEFSDDQHTLHGAYGHRWREHFGFDQIPLIIQKLTHDPTTRQAVLTMWDPEDLRQQSKDIPCNTHIRFKVENNHLDMLVCCRSNDAVWGAHGANAVHLSFLQEFIALACDLAIGTMCQISSNYHIYERHWHLLEAPLSEVAYPYHPSIPLLEKGESWEDFLDECKKFVAIRGNAPQGLTNGFLRTVVVPMMDAWHLDPLSLKHMVPCDWKAAGQEYFNKRRIDNE